ncbi:MAG: SGNH/GDSL hydrolase family protein [Phycisphaera sp.]|nr:SGNH/GDSL hydrolase family protein [Phycisphaera sp.]
MRSIGIIWATLTMAVACSIAASPVKPELVLKQRLDAGKAQHVVAYGTSLTAAGAWVKQVEAALSERYPGKVKVTNSGGSGQNSRWGLANLQTKVIDQKPDLVFIEFAINDAVARFDLPLDEARKNLETMLDRIAKDLPDCVVVLQVMNPMINYPEGHRSHRNNLDGYYQMYRDVAAERKLGLVDHAPSWKPVYDQGEAAFKKLAPDGLHPNAEGCTRIVTPDILKALGFATDEK